MNPGIQRSTPEVWWLAEGKDGVGFWSLDIALSTIGHVRKKPERMNNQTLLIVACLLILPCWAISQNRVPNPDSVASVVIYQESQDSFGVFSGSADGNRLRPSLRFVLPLLNEPSDQLPVPNVIQEPPFSIEDWLVEPPEPVLVNYEQVLAMIDLHGLDTLSGTLVYRVKFSADGKYIRHKSISGKHKVLESRVSDQLHLLQTTPNPYLCTFWVTISINFPG